MLKTFKEFQSLLSDNSIFIENKSLNKVFQKFSFHLFVKENRNSISNIDEITKQLQKNEHRDIVISYYLEKEENYSNFFIICFEKTVLIIEKNEIDQFSQFFSQNHKSTIYIRDENIKSSINLPLQFSIITENCLLLINKFSESFQIRIKKKSLANFLKRIIIEPISIFLILKSYNKLTSYDRVLNYNDYKNKFNDVNIDENEYIKLLELNEEQIIYFIYHIELEEILLLKIFCDYKAKDLFERESQNYLKIHYPLFPKYFGKTMLSSYQCLIIEYIHGSTLDRINEMKLTKEIKFKIVFQIMIALHYLHYHDFIYRDLKPENIIFNKNGSITLIDFDRMILNQQNFQSTKDFQLGFIAPEIIEGKSFSSKSDIYSLGKIIEFIFLDEFSNSEKLNEYKILYEMYEKCTEIDDKKRPDILTLINVFFNSFLSKLDIFKDINAIIKESFVQNHFNFDFLFYVSEFDHPISKHQLLKLSQNNIKEQLILGLFYKDGEFIERDINKSIHYLTLAANQNDPDAQFHLGLIYEKGEFIEQDINKSIHYYSLAANQNHSDAQYNLGVIYMNNKYIERDIKKSIHYFTLAANQNDPSAQYIIGLIYMNNKYIERNINKSIHYFTLAANQNDPDAQFHLGLIYEKGEFIERDINKSIYFYSLAANQNHLDAQYNLGVIYMNNKYIERDIKKSIHYFTLAANQNHSDAQYNLGLIYENGEFIERDINKSIHYYSLAANQNHSEALFNLGVIYNTSRYVKQDINKAIHYFTLSAEQNFSLAQYNLGVMFSDGRYIPRDINKSIHYYTLAAKQNNLDALFNLGSMYAYGRFLEPDINKAIYYYTLAAHQNHMQSQYNLGIIYRNSDYIQRDINKAIYYYTLAANQNSIDAQYNLGVIYESGECIKRDIDKAIYYYTLAANQNYMNAQHNLGIIYISGEYVPRDINKSIHYLTLSANQNHVKSQYHLGEIYANGEYNVKRDINKAIYYYKLASDQNDSGAQYDLGLIYIDGKYVPRDINKAIHYITLAANQNDPDAQHLLGIIYGNGEYVPQDINKSVHYFTLAVNQNHRISLLKFGLFYLNGIYFQKDYQKSLHYFMRAAYHRNNEANYYIALFYCKGYCVHRDFDKAIAYFKECSSFNDQHSKNNLGILYKNIKQNEVSIEYFKEAIRQKNDKISMYNLGHIYFYGDFIKGDIKKSIELFIKSSNKGFYPSKIMLSLAIVKQITTINITNISNELKNHGNEAIELNQIIYSIIQEYKLQNEFNYHILFSSYKKKEYFYDFFMKEVIYLDFINEKQDNKSEDNTDMLRKNIDEFFLEGFSI